jgi:hypothetical protein
MRDRSGKSIKAPHNHGIESTSVSVRHEPIQVWATAFGARNSYVKVFADAFLASSLSVLAKFAGLHCSAPKLRVDGGQIQ